jgi:hypothetical protein
MIEQSIAYELEMLRHEVLFYKIMTGTFAKTLTTKDDGIDSIAFQEVQITAADQITELMAQDIETAQKWADVNVFDFRKKIELESEDNEYS